MEIASDASESMAQATAPAARVAGVPPVNVAATAPAPLPPIPKAPGDGVDPQDFVRANRIHVKDGSLFIDPYLVIHPRELEPSREAALRAKLQLTYSITNPSFYEDPKRASIALNLGQLVPVSLAAKRSQLLEQVQQFNTQVDTGRDAELTQQATDKRQPFTAIVRDTIQNPTVDPVGLEVLKNGLALYMLAREKLTANGYYNRLSDYVLRNQTPDQVLSDLADKTGATPQQVREAALKGGVTAVGQLLKLDPRYVADVKQLAEYAATQDFGYNLVEHWHLGRQLLGIQAPLEKKITAGMDARITAKIGEYRNRTRHHYTVPQPIVAQERQIADSMHLVEPIQRKLLYALGYEICFSPEVTADAIAFHPGIYGLHRKASNDLRDVRGTYRIYFSGKGDAEGSVRTLCHEIAHNLWPDHFSPDHAAAIDALAARDQQRFARLNTLLRTPETFDQFAKLHAAYQAGNPQEKEAITQAADQLFASIGINVGGVLPFLKDPFELRNLVTYAQDTLQVEGARYNHSGYDSPQERFREVISRFAEVKQVRLRGQPELLNFIAPGLNTIWNQLYIPHLEQVYHQVQRYGTAVPPSAAPAPLTQQPDVAGAPATAVDTKVRQQPAAGGHADACSCQGCVADNAQPDKSVDKSSIHLTKSVHAAQSALDAMGVHASLNYR